ncbi:phage tail assembly protein T [Escherichia coli]|nr:phage tail assembly protein T [Escherichia coli]
MGRPDWRAMLAGMTSTEYADWRHFYRTHYFQDTQLDMHFSGLMYAVLSLFFCDPDTDGALITGLTFLDPKDATQVQGLFQHLQVRFGDGPWQDVKGLDEVGSDTGRTGE